MNNLVPQISIAIGQGGGSGEIAGAMKIFMFMTFLSIGPAILLTMTSFTRIVIVLSFLRQAMGVSQSPPNQVIIGIALFLTFFVMAPALKQINETSVKPFLEEKISPEIALENATKPIKNFMYQQTRKKDLELMLKLAKEDVPSTIENLSLKVLIPSFVLSELKTAFEIGFLIYLPFVLIDMVVSMILLTMGMMVLPPVMISLPFKLMLFVLVDGWNLVVGSLVGSFR
ncbi:MAG: Flagellar biosynthesis protein FliP [uncultured bacterium]|nr:MAG: Flagellar biosynthesis protein FliP [uncultured bacterium]